MPPKGKFPSEALNRGLETLGCTATFKSDLVEGTEEVCGEPVDVRYGETGGWCWRHGHELFILWLKDGKWSEFIASWRRHAVRWQLSSPKNQVLH